MAVAQATGWTYKNLSALTTASRAAGAPFGYADVQAGKQCENVVYRDGAGHIILLSSTDSKVWTNADLTQIASANVAVSDPAAWVSAAGNPAVAFCDAKGHVNVLSRSSSGWHSADLTQAVTTTTPLAAIGDPSPFLLGTGNDLHVVYRAVNGRIMQLRRDQQGVHLDDLSKLTTVIDAAGSPCAYAMSGTTQSSVVYRATDGRIINLFRTATGWRQGNVTGQAGAPLAASEPIGYPLANGTQVFSYSDVAGNIIELSGADGAWHAQNLTTKAKAAVAAGAQPYPFRNHQQAASRLSAYRDGRGHLIKLAYDGIIATTEDLSAALKASLPAGRPCGFELRREVRIADIAYREGSGQIILMSAHEYS